METVRTNKITYELSEKDVVDAIRLWAKANSIELDKKSTVRFNSEQRFSTISGDRCIVTCTIEKQLEVK